MDRNRWMNRCVIQYPINVVQYVLYLHGITGWPGKNGARCLATPILPKNNRVMMMMMMIMIDNYDT
jgi:hypothetical protein